MILAKFYVTIYLIFCIECYRKFIKQQLKNDQVLFLSFVIDLILIFILLNHYVLLMYFVIRLFGLKLRIIYVKFYFVVYNKYEYVYNRDFYNLMIPNITRYPKIYNLFIVLSLVLILYKSVVLVIFFGIIFADVNFLKFNAVFDEAYNNRYEDRLIILFPSGKAKLDLYYEELIDPTNEYIFALSYESKGRVYLIPQTDFFYITKKYSVF